MVQTLQMILAQAEVKDNNDAFSRILGQLGTWQMIIFLSVSLVKLSSGWVQMAILFLTPSLKYWCVEFKSSVAPFGNNTASSIGMVINSTCYKDCERYDYDTGPFDRTIVSEWDLICEKRWLTSFTQMVLQFGILIGSIVFGFMSDRFGRKITFLVSVTTLIAFGFAIPFSPSYVFFTTFRFFLGMATAGTMVVSFVIVMETVGPKYRELLGCLFQIPFIIGHMTVPVFAYFFRTWESYTLALAVPPLMYLGYFFLLTESPRWLVSVGRVEEASVIVTKAAQINNRPTTNIKEQLSKLSQAINSNVPEKPNYLQLLHRSLRVKTTCCCFIWFITGITFFGLNQYIGQTSPDPFISVGAAGAIQIPSILASIGLIRYFGRRLTTITASGFGGVCIIALACLPNTFAIQLTLGTLGVSCASIVATTIYIFTSELYPTVVRNMGMGASSTAMRIGSMLAPFISNLSVTVPWLPTVIFGLAPILAAALCLLLPETKDTLLPDSINDVKIKPRNIKLALQTM
ncbi:hypothetical protein ACJJTC_013314 [Scirpophaga incertulas]